MVNRFPSSETVALRPHYYPTVYALYLYYIQKYANNQLRILKGKNDDKA